MVKVPVAEDQRIHPGRVDLQQLEIVGIDAGGKAEIQQIALRLTASNGPDVQRQTPLAFERLALRDAREADALHTEAGAFERPQEDVVRVVGNLSYDKMIDDRRVDARGRCSRGSADAAGNERAAQRRRGLQQTPAIQ